MSTAMTDNAGNPATKKLPVYEVLAQDIKAMGIEVVFGLMSDDTAVFAVTLDAIGIPFYGARHENTAVAMADAYSEATGGLAIAVIGRGPATANGLHASVFANRTGSRVLIIYGEAPISGGQPNGLGPDYKAFNAGGVLQAAGLQTFLATSPAAARSALADAAAAASKGGAVTLRLPVNVQLAEIEVPADDPGPAPLPARPAPQLARPQSVELAAELLAKAKRPLIVGGFGAHLSGAGPVLRQLADKIGAGLATSARGKDLFAGHPCNLGIVGSFSHSAGRRVIEQADCVIVFGAGLNFFTMSFGHSLPAVPLIQVDAVRAKIGQWTTADVALVGDARLVAEQLLDRLEERDAANKPLHAADTLDDLAKFDIASDFQAANTSRTLDPRSAAMAFNRLLPTNRNMVYDAGNFLGVVPYFDTPGPGHFKMTNVFASIGLGVGAALGFARARPEATTVFVTGDGGLMMTLGELETVVREDLPMVILVMNDCAYGAEVHFLRMHQLPIAKSLFPDIEFASIAEALGYETATVRTLEEIEALAPMLANPDAPILVDVKVNADVAAAFMSELAQFEGRDHED